LLILIDELINSLRNNFSKTR